MSLSKQLPSKLSRGSHLSFTDSKVVALEIGSLIDNAERDIEDRIKLNPILDQVEKLLGAPCKINNFVELSTCLMDKLAKYLQRDISQIYMSKRGRGNIAGTWYVKLTASPTYIQ
jgi:hypothetical protein